MPAPETLQTVDALYGIPDDGRRWELQAGTLVSEPMPGFRHGRVLVRIAGALDLHVSGAGLGAVVADTAFVLARDPDTVRGPDVAFVAAERIAVGTDLAGAWDGPPDLAIEIVSPSNTADAMHTKVAEYLAAGTRLVWVVDPARRTVTTYRSLLQPVVRTEPESLDAAEIVPGFSIPIARVFDP